MSIQPGLKPESSSMLVNQLPEKRREGKKAGRGVGRGRKEKTEGRKGGRGGKKEKKSPDYIIFQFLWCK